MPLFATLFGSILEFFCGFSEFLSTKFAQITALSLYLQYTV